MGTKVKKLLLDIETAPLTVLCWGMFKQNIGLNQIVKDWRILTYAAKWVGDTTSYWDSTEKSKSELGLLETLWELLDEADIVIAHNGDRFDIPKVNGKFLEYGLSPPSPYKTVDTLKVVRKNFKLTSNKLDYVSRYLGSDGKMQTGGMQLWVDCMAGVHKAWVKMVDYNIKDVLELERVYLEILPWISTHPNVALYDDEADTVCPKCGGKHIHFRGYAYTGTSKFRRFQCQDCGGWGRLAVNVLSKLKRKTLGRNVA